MVRWYPRASRSVSFNPRDVRRVVVDDDLNPEVQILSQTTRWRIIEHIVEGDKSVLLIQYLDSSGAMQTIHTFTPR